MSTSKVSILCFVMSVLLILYDYHLKMTHTPIHLIDCSGHIKLGRLQLSHCTSNSVAYDGLLVLDLSGSLQTVVDGICHLQFPSGYVI